MATLIPGYTLTTGGQQWTSQVVGLEVQLAAAPLTGTLEADLPAPAPLSAGVGDPVTLDLDGGEGGTRVFTGTVTALRRTPAGIRVHAVDAAGLLARLRPATSYEQVNAGTVIRDLADQAGIDTGDVDDGVALAWYPADPARTALDHVARLCAWSGALARVDADGRLVASAVAATQAELALRYGREVLAVEQTGRRRDVAGFTVAGEAGAWLNPTLPTRCARPPTSSPEPARGPRRGPPVGVRAGPAQHRRGRRGRRRGPLAIRRRRHRRPGDRVPAADPAPGHGDRDR